MTTITTTPELIQVWVQPAINGYSNVVQRIDWLLHFERGTVRSTAQIETLLDLTNFHTDNFILAENLDSSTVLAWALAAQGGQKFIDVLMPFHTERLDHLEKQIGIVPFALNDQ